MTGPAARISRRDFLIGLRPPPEPAIRFDAAKCWTAAGIQPDCDYCFDRCPEKGEAVNWTRGAGPRFDADRCTACGFCQYYCPADPAPIKVKGF